MFQLLTQLAEQIAAAWRAETFSAEAFPEIAQRAICSETFAAFRREFSVEKVCQWLGQGESLPHQYDPSNQFGQPPLTVLVDQEQRFFFDLYFWQIPNTAIHDHKFCGAYTVLNGRSLNITYDFKQSVQYADHMLGGELTVSGYRIVDADTSEKIEGGSSFIHSVQHLTAPTISFIIRTPDYPVPAQYHYMRGGLALAAAGRSLLQNKQLGLLAAVSNFYPDQRRPLLDLMLASASPGSAARLIIELMAARDFRAVDIALTSLELKSPELGSRMRTVVTENATDLMVHQRHTTDEFSRAVVGLATHVGLSLPVLEFLAQNFGVVDIKSRARDVFTDLSYNGNIPPDFASYIRNAVGSGSFSRVHDNNAIMHQIYSAAIDRWGLSVLL